MFSGNIIFHNRFNLITFESGPLNKITRNNSKYISERSIWRSTDPITNISSKLTSGLGVYVYIIRPNDENNAVGHKTDIEYNLYKRVQEN